MGGLEQMARSARSGYYKQCGGKWKDAGKFKWGFLGSGDELDDLLNDFLNFCC
jgi:hypothetical protein